jgi:hypothetical protein
MIVDVARKAIEALTDITPGVPAAPGDWTRIFESVDRHGRYVRRQKGRPEERFTVPGGDAVSKGMKTVGMALADMADYGDGGSIFGGWRRLVTACSMHRATVIRCRGQLRAAGWIYLVQEAGQEFLPRTWSNVYQLTIPAPYHKFLEGLALTDPDHPQGGDLDLPRGRHARPSEPPRPDVT